MSGVGGVNAEIFLARQANQWTMGRRWLRWGTADLGPRAHIQRMGRAMPQEMVHGKTALENR